MAEFRIAMKLRDRFLLYSTAQLAMFAAVCALAYGAFAHSVLPRFEELLRANTEQVVRMTATQLDVPLGADDQVLLLRTVNRVIDDPDFSYLVIKDARERAVLVRGVPPAGAFLGTEAIARVVDREIRAWAPVKLEGLNLGSVAVGFSMARLAALAIWARRIAAGVILFWPWRPRSGSRARSYRRSAR